MAHRPNEGSDGRVHLAAWTTHLTSPAAEARAPRRWAHIGGVVAVTALVAYLTWRILYSLPPSGWNRIVAWVLVAFETLPLPGLIYKTVSLWSIDAPLPDNPRPEFAKTARVVVVIPTYNEPRDVLAPTVAAACNLVQPHETWVLDDGDRDWVEEMCGALGARYVRRPVHDHAKAGNINHALGILEAEELAGIGGADVLAVLDCDHVPLPNFLADTLTWFDDPKVALVQGPQAFYNRGAFDDDGYTGEQGLFFNVLMPSRHHVGANPFWCGSTSFVRMSALQEIGGVATDTIVEDLHTTLKLLEAGWKTAYHHQTLAVGLAPSTPEQYLLQRRRWGMGAMQVLVKERLWRAKHWMSWRTFQEYLSATLWWLEGIATLLTLAVPIAVLVSGAQTSTAKPWQFTVAFGLMFVARLWGMKRVLRKNIKWPNAFALRVMRVPVGMACLWWLLSRNALQFAVTPKGGSDNRSRGRPPRVLYVLLAVTVTVCGYAALGVGHLVPWRTPVRSTIASGLWLSLATAVLLLGVLRIRSTRFATSRRDAPRFPVRVPVSVSGIAGELVDVSVGGASIRVNSRYFEGVSHVTVRLPGHASVPLEVVRTSDDGQFLYLRVAEGDWASLSQMALWLFHTPSGAVAGLPAGVPLVAAITLDQAAPGELLVFSPRDPEPAEAAA